MKVRLEHLTKRFPNSNRTIKTEVTAVDDVTLEIPDGQLAVLLGPSGCGKSTALNLICGLEKPTEGRIYFGDDDVTDLAPENRGVGLVFQNYALYPHMTALQNILFPLQNLKGEAKLSREQMTEKAMEAAKLVQIEELLDKKEKLSDDYEAVRSNFRDIGELNGKIDNLSKALSSETYSYYNTLSMLAETNRRLKCFKEEKDAIVKGDDFKTQTTGANVSIKGENISLTSVDGEGNLRDNEGSGITLTANEVSVASVEADGRLKEKGRVRIQAKNVEVTTAGEADQQVEDEKGLTDASYAAEGDFIVTSKNITLESIDYELAESKLKEKQLSADSRIKLRAKTIEVSTENSANVEVDEEGQMTNANYTAEGDVIIHSKTFTVESADYDLENGETKEKALTADSKVTIRAEKMNLATTDTEGKLAEGSTMVVVAEKMFMGAKSKDVKSKKVQVVSEEIGAFADNTFEAQQGEAKAALQLADGKAVVGGDATEVYGPTEVKAELKTPKATIDHLKVTASFNSPNISDGVAGGPGSGSISAKLQPEDAPEDTSEV